MASFGLAVLDVGLEEWMASGPFDQKQQPDVKVNLNADLTANANKRTVSLSISVAYVRKSDPAMKIVSCKVVTHFKVRDPESSSGTMEIPDQGYLTMISIAINHCRALFIHQAKAFGLHGFSVPLVNPADVLNQIRKRKHHE